MPSNAVDMLLSTIRSEAKDLRFFTIAFLTLLLYLSLIVVATDHEQILRISPVKLPLLDVEIPVLGFYWFMPPFLFFMHLYILVQHYLFSQLAFKFEEVLSKESFDMQDNIRRRLGNLPFMHWLLGRRSTIMQLIMVSISLISLVIWPVFMFWWMQAKFLPYHDENLVFWQQICLSTDIAMLAYLWAKTLDRSDNALHWWRQMAQFGFGLRRLCVCEWRYTRLHWQRWNTAILSRPVWAWLGLWLQIGWQVMIATTHRQRLQIGFGSLQEGINRLLFILLLLTALFFSWLVSITPDSKQEERLVASLISNYTKVTRYSSPNFERMSNTACFNVP
ncbi:hypothetical protein [Methylovulum miyakonense]|uniref:hypothetical protein n=1 Tax=Methylovulum miyakonense TaxID=645578 RepID=UPI0012EB092E|nr:hypothetical protein [Methylovulum miyakonense]